jgi:hypothetical protein
MEGQCECKEARVYVKRADGSLEPVALSPALAERAEMYRALQRMGLDPEAIRLVWVTRPTLG